jgi:glycosyltransferase involved in cell wall biosynthesis
MRISILTSAHPPDDSRIYFREARTLSRKHSVTLIHLKGKGENVTEEGIRIIGLKEPKNRFIRAISTFRLFRETLKTDADFFHLHDPELLLVGVFLKLFKKIKVIYDIHEDFPNQIKLKAYIPKPFRSLIAFFANWWEAFFCRFVDALIVADEFIEEKYKRFNKNLIVLHNYPPLRDFQEVKGDFHPYSLIYEGSLTFERGIDVIIEAFKRIQMKYPKAELHLVGSVHDSRINNLLNKHKNIKYHGKVTYNDVPEYIKKAHIGLAVLKPAQKFLRNIPGKIFEYMACSKPIIASDLPPIKKFLKGSGCAILTEPNNIDDVVKAIYLLFENQNKSREMGKSGRKLFLEKYNWETEEDKLYELYESIKNKLKK